MSRSTMIVGAAHLAVGVLALGGLAGFGLLALRRRLDLRRSVLIHASAAEIWKLVRGFPSLHGAFGKAREFGAVQNFILIGGDGEGEGSIWRVLGQWRRKPYWAEVEVVCFESPEVFGFRLLRDSLGTHRSLLDHSCSLSLLPIDPRTTKLCWSLRARLRGPRLAAARLLSGERLAARLLDQGLRSIKRSAEAASRHARQADRREAPEAHPGPSLQVTEPTPRGEGTPGSGLEKSQPRRPRPRGPIEPTL